MDAHRDQVMAAREKAGAGTRRYFAYSTILDREAFEAWRAQHGYGFFDLPEGVVGEALDVALVYDFQSRWWGGRVAGLADRPGASVFGKLIEISEKDWPVIQHKEGRVTHMCGERPVRVKVGDEILEATAFTTRPERRTDEGPVSERFVEALIRGAQSAGLPDAYVRGLGAPETSRTP